MRGGEDEPLLFNGYRAPVWVDEKSWKWVVEMVVHLMSLICTLKNGYSGNFVYIF